MCSGPIRITGQAMLLESAALSSRCDSVQDFKKKKQNKRTNFRESSKKINILLERTVKYDAELHKPT